ncbi:hypothetical protein EHF33_15360 [Deinococcus psychrotolerans]|uniref:Uncharacterized protein n=1 Tax=Deinococcus psychrotolerans TaxID=2489213 RepID=A0A3G8YJ09_9DEIO|nr:hypothetical protein EHF33_15360 [Deinococcus psychrotolerans]
MVRARDCCSKPSAHLSGRRRVVPGFFSLRPWSASPPACTCFAAIDRREDGWAWPLSEDEVLSRLLALNLERAARHSVAS